jgi:hypothetical protein
VGEARANDCKQQVAVVISTRSSLARITHPWQCVVVQAFALSKPDRPELVELLRAQPVLPTPGHRIVVDPPSTLEPLPLPPGSNLSGGGAAAADGQAGSLGLGGLGYGGSIGTALDDAAAANEEPLPDDVPLTRAQLQAKVGVLIACLSSQGLHGMHQDV